MASTSSGKEIGRATKEQELTLETNTFRNLSSGLDDSIRYRPRHLTRNNGVTTMREPETPLQSFTVAFMFCLTIYLLMFL